MNILFISHEATRSGAPLALLYLLKEIKRRNIDINFTVLQLEGGPLTEEFQRLCPVITLPERPWKIEHIFKQDTLRQRIAIRLLLHHLKKQHFELIYANTIVSLSTAIALKGNLSVPLLLHAHEASHSMTQKGLTENMIRQCDEFIGASNIVDDGLRALGASSNHIHIVYPFSALADRIVKEGITSPSHPANHQVKIGLVGPLTERKGADFLPLIIKQLSILDPDCNYVIQCIGTFIEGITKKIYYDLDRIGMKDKIQNFGSVSDPLPLYHPLDFLIMLSREDPFPLALVENGLLSKPCILWEGSTGTQRFIENGVNGLVVPYLDIDAMANAIYLLSKDTERRLSMGKKFQSTLMRHYEKAETNSEIIKVLTDIGHANEDKKNIRP